MWPFVAVQPKIHRHGGLTGCKIQAVACTVRYDMLGLDMTLME